MSLSDLITPNVEQFLSSIPELLGAYESAKGRPIGSVLSMLGGFGDQNAQNRRTKGDVGALTKLAGGYTAQNAPTAYGQFQQLQPLLSQMSPEMQEAQLENIQSLGEKEQTRVPRAPQRYFNVATGGIEQHDPQEYKDGILPKNLIPWGGLAAKLYGKAMGLPEQTGKEPVPQMEWDAQAKATYGVDYNTLSKQNPQAANAVIEAVQKRGAQNSLGNALNLIAPRNDAELARQVAASGALAHSQEERDVLQNYNLTPDQYRALPPAQRHKIHADTIASEAADSAIRTTANANARGDVAANMSKQKWLDTPLAQKGMGVFAVDPKTFAIVNDPSLTPATAAAKGLKLLPQSLEASFNQGYTALHGLDDMVRAGSKILPATGGSTYTTTANVDVRDMLHDSDARAYKASQVNLIPALRYLAGTSRPNQKELETAIKNLQNVANQQQLQAAVGQAQQTIRRSMSNLTGQGEQQTKASLRSLTDDARLKAAYGTPDAASPDPGYSASF